MSSRYMMDLEWRICHAVNIYVYKNGVEGQTPILIHIPPNKKKNMRCVMSVIQERIYYPIGYAKYLYKMNGKKVTSPAELEMYNNYVVASNYDKEFKRICYARRKSPLLVLGKESKHVRELILKNYQYELYLAKKRTVDEKSNCFYYTTEPFVLLAEKSANCQPCARVSVPVCPHKNYSRRRHSIVVPAVKQNSKPYIPTPLLGQGSGQAWVNLNSQVGYEWNDSNLLYQSNPNPTVACPVPPSKLNYPQSRRTTPLMNEILNYDISPPPTSSYNLSLNSHKNQIKVQFQIPQSQIYSVNDSTITTTKFKDRFCLNDVENRDPSKNKNKENFNCDQDSNNCSGRYAEITNDQDSLFYSSKKKMMNKGVVDVSGETKKFFYRESDPNENVDSNFDEHQNDSPYLCPTLPSYQPINQSLVEKSTQKPLKTFRSHRKNYRVDKLSNSVETDLNNNFQPNQDPQLFHKEEMNDGSKFSSNFDQESQTDDDGRLNFARLDFQNETKSTNSDQNLRNDVESSSIEKTDNLDSTSISAPSNSYIVLAKSHQIPVQNRYTQVTPLVSSGTDQNNFPQEIPHLPHAHIEQRILKDLSNNYQDTSSKYFNDPHPAPSHQFNEITQLFYKKSPIYLPQNPNLNYIPPNHNSYYVQSAVINSNVPTQNQSFGHSLSRSNMTHLTPQKLSPSCAIAYSCRNSSSTDELNIPFTQLDQRANLTLDPMSTTLRPYIQMPQLFLTSNPLSNQQFGYRGDLYNYTNCRNLTDKATFKKSNKKNVTVQMGQPNLNLNMNLESSSQNHMPTSSFKNFAKAPPPSGERSTEVQLKDREKQKNDQIYGDSSNNFSFLPPPTRYRDTENQRGHLRNGGQFEC